VLRWEGEARAADGTALRLREKVERVDDDTLHATWEVEAESGWQPLSEETLRRAK
jgi:hypothetical protein